MIKKIAKCKFRILELIKCEKILTDGKIYMKYHIFYIDYH